MVNHPPKWADRFLRLICADQHIDELQGDLHELYYRNCQMFGLRKANWKYIFNALISFRFYRLSNGNNSYYSPNRMDIFKLNLKLGYRHTEVPCTKIYPPRSVGYTKMKPLAAGFSRYLDLAYKSIDY